MSRFLRLVSDLAAAHELPVITAVRHAVRDLTRADGVTFVMRDGAFCHYVDEDAIAPLWKGRRFPLDDCVSGWVMRHATPAIIPDIFADPRVPVDVYRPTFVRSLAMVPVRRTDAVAAIGAYWATPYHPAPEEVELLLAVADASALALANAVLYGDLRYQTDLTRIVADNAASMIMMMDPDGRATYVNPAVTRVTGYAPEELLGEVLHEKVHWKYPDGRPYPISECPLDRALPHREPVQNVREVFVRKDGSVFPVVCSGMPIVKDGRAVGTVIEVRDVTEEDRTEALARESESRFQEMADVSPVMIWVTDEEGRIEFVNRAYREFFGVTDEQLKVHGWLPLVHPDDLSEYAESFRESLRSGKPFFGEARVRRADGRWRWIASYAAARRSPSGACLGSVGSSPDITDMKAAAHEALEASRLKDEFLAVLSHELRTPLNAILGWTQILGERLPADHPGMHAVTVIRRNAAHQQQLVEDLLEVSRVITGKLRLGLVRADLAAAVAAAVDVVRPACAGKRIRLETAIEGPAVVLGDPDRLQQIVWNILSNAVKFTPAGGSIRVSLAAHDDTAVVSIRDSGQGIAPEVLPHIFERFRQADSTTTRAHSGLGIGLALARALTEAHGGEIRARSDGPGLGAEFSLHLPLIDAPSDDVSSRSGAAIPDLRGHRVLIVDDDEDAREMMAAMLRLNEIDTSTAASVAEALERLEQLRPDLLLVDIGMPERDGYALIETIRSGSGPQASVPALAVTAYAGVKDRERALRAGFDGHVPKPGRQDRAPRGRRGRAPGRYARSVTAGSARATR